jgi:autotransporter translocation and assembly factor TamB
MKEKPVNEMLADLTTRVPWALFGFTQDLEKAWRKDPEDVIAAVDSRYQQQNSKAAAAAAPES